MKVIVAIATALAAVGVAPAASALEPAGIHESFASIADGPAPDVAVGGTKPVTNYQSSTAAAPYVRDGFLTTTNPDAALGGAYRIADLDADVTTVGASFAFTPYAVSGGVLCLSIQADNISASPSVPVSPIHFIISPTSWALDMNTVAGTGVDGLVGGAFDTALVADSETLHRVEITLDRAASKARVIFPDGATRTFTNPAFGLSGEYVYVEPFKSPSPIGGPLAEQTNALVSEWWADAAPVEVVEAGEAVPKVRAPQPVTVAETAPVVASIAESPAPTLVDPFVTPAAPRSVKAKRHGSRVAVTFRSSSATSARVKCGTVARFVDGERATLRSAAKRCKVRSVSTHGKMSQWVVARVSGRR